MRRQAVAWEPTTAGDRGDMIPVGSSRCSPGNRYPVAELLQSTRGQLIDRDLQRIRCGGRGICRHYGCRSRVRKVAGGNGHGDMRRIHYGGCAIASVPRDRNSRLEVGAGQRQHGIAAAVGKRRTGCQDRRRVVLQQLRTHKRTTQKHDHYHRLIGRIIFRGGQQRRKPGKPGQTELTLMKPRLNALLLRFSFRASSVCPGFPPGSRWPAHRSRKFRKPLGTSRFRWQLDTLTCRLLIQRLWSIGWFEELSRRRLSGSERVSVLLAGPPPK